MNARRRHLATLAAGAALLIPTGCGSSDEKEGEPLPQDAVAAISQRLDEVQRRYDAGTRDNNPGACEDIEDDSYRAIDATVEGLPADVDPDVRKALEESLSRLQELTREGCADVEERRPEPETTPQETPPPQTVPQPTVPEPTKTQETAPPEKPKQKEEDPDKGNGNRNGNGGQPDEPEEPGANGGGQPAPEAGTG